MKILYKILVLVVLVIFLVVFVVDFDILDVNGDGVISKSEVFVSEVLMS